MNKIYQKGGIMGEKRAIETSMGGTMEQIDESFFREHEGRIHQFLLEALEKPLIEKVLKRTAGNQVKAAKVLGINRNTLRTKIRQLGIKKTVEFH